MSTKIQLEPEARDIAQATANLPFLFYLRPEKGRATVEAAIVFPHDRLFPAQPKL